MRNPVTDYEYLVPREVMDAYPPERDVVDSPFISLNTSSEFVVTVEKSPLDQFVGRRRDDGTIVVAVREQHRTEKSIATRILWVTNDVAAFVMEVLLRSPQIPFSTAPVDWRHPLRQTAEAVDVPGVTVADDLVTWNEGRSWIRVSPVERYSGVSRLAAWLPFTPREVLNSFDDPPGVVGLVPYSRFEPISVERARAITAELRRRRNLRP